MVNKTTQATGLSTGLGKTGFALNFLFTIIAIVSFCLRVWVKITTKRDTASHDVLSFGAVVFALAFSIGYSYCIHSGVIGLHMTDAIYTEPNVQKTTYKLFFVAGFIWILSTTLVKLSVLHLYRLIFLGEHRAYIQGRPFKYAINTLYTLLILFCISHILLALLECQPIERQWNKNVNGRCTDTYKQNLADTITNMVLDLLVIVLPMPLLWQLQMPMATKLKVCGIFGLGLFICATNIARVVVIASTRGADVTYNLVHIGLLCRLEIYLGIVAACYPLFNSVLFRRRKIASHHAKRPFFSFNNTIGGQQRNRGVDDGFSTLRTVGDDDVSLRGYERTDIPGAFNSELVYQGNGEMSVVK
ncbi:unnamed protein product [Periconia digitata]|uniref:Rhodopsin domain-containing protein n=1 Tax=Periconia digitata TaxID=1303443 RepID=A0A9W4UL56_9PLEO|nr:unnamed protein product [Periconia digitata]